MPHFSTHQSARISRITRQLHQYLTTHNYKTVLDPHFEQRWKCENLSEIQSFSNSHKQSSCGNQATVLLNLLLKCFLIFFFLLWMSLKLVGMSAMTFSNAVSLEMTFLIKPKFTQSLWNFTKSYFEVIFTVCFFVSSGLHMASSLISLTATKRPRAWFHLQNLLFQMGFDVLIAIKTIKRKGLKKIRHHHRKQCKNSLRQQNC